MPKLSRGCVVIGRRGPVPPVPIRSRRIARKCGGVARSIRSRKCGGVAFLVGEFWPGMTEEGITERDD